MTVTRRDITNQFTQTNLQLLIAFADQAAVAIDNARLFAVEQQRARRQQQLANTAGALLNARTLSELGLTITAVAHQTLDADRVAIYLYDAVRKSIKCLYAHNLSTTTDALNQFYRTMPGARLLSNTQPITIDDALDDYRTASLRDIISAEGFRSYAVFSMSIPGDPVGALVFYRDRVAPSILTIWSPGKPLPTSFPSPTKTFSCSPKSARHWSANNVSTISPAHSTLPQIYLPSWRMWHAWQPTCWTQTPDWSGWLSITR